MGSGAKPQPTDDLCISGPKGPALVATVFVHFIKINVIFCDFEAEGSIKFSMEMHRFANAAAVLENLSNFGA